MDDINPNICSVCWYWIKGIHRFKRDCFKIEKSLKAYCIEKQLNQLSDNDIHTVITRQVYPSDTCFHQEYFSKYGQVYPNLDYDSLMQEINFHSDVMGGQKNVGEPNEIQYDKDDIEENTESLWLSDKNYSGGNIITVDDDCMIVEDNANSDIYEIEYDKINSFINIEDEDTRSTIILEDATLGIEDTRSAIVVDNTIFEPKLIVEHENNHSIIVIDDEETRSAIGEDVTNFQAKEIVECNNNDFAIVIEDDESQSMFVENNASFNPIEIFDHNRKASTKIIDNEETVECNNNIYSAIVIEDEETNSMIVQDNTNVYPTKVVECNNNNFALVIEDDESESMFVANNASFNPNEIVDHNRNKASTIDTEETVECYNNNNNNSAIIVIEDEETNSMIVQDNTNFYPTKVVECNNNNFAIVIEDDESQSMIVEDSASFNPWTIVDHNKQYFTRIIDDEETRTIISPNKSVENIFDVPKNKDVSADFVIVDNTPDLLIVDEDCNEENDTPTQKNYDNEEMLVMDNDCYEIGTESELTAEVTFVETKYNIEETQLNANEARSNSNLKIWGCYVCSQVFLAKLKMRKHLMNHENPENKYGNFKCYKCPYRVKFMRGLTMHKCIHSKGFRKKYSGFEKNYFCQYCDDIFTEKGDIELHMSQHLISLNKFLCTWCSTTTDSSVELRAHYRKIHGQRKYRNF